MDAPEKDPPATKSEKPTQKRAKRDERSRRRAESHEVSQASRRSDTAGSQLSSGLTGVDDRSHVSRRSSGSRRTRRSASRESSKHVPPDNARAEVAVSPVSRPEITPDIHVAPLARIASPLPDVPHPPVTPASPFVLPLAGDPAPAEASGAVPSLDETSEKPTCVAPGASMEPPRRASKQEAPAGTLQAIATEPEAAPAEQLRPEEAAEQRPEPVQTARTSNAPEEGPESKRPVVIAAMAIIVFVLVVAILKHLRASTADVTGCVGCANSTQSI
ncbi:translation initiation factor IF-2-like [Rhipicephalus sanguineus]|uniref:translation initiation factor IF-2-like n=1 Tax=Rhipicephalus sanguineus TaxID=34632 RepID=UPI00189320B9|nr:translation initiation factor IF-2-like [Rhipicephalus sanguineus]